MSPDLSSWRGDNLTEPSHFRRVKSPVVEQLDLFADNRRTIWLNRAHEALGCLDLEGALASYGRIVEAGLDDREIRDERNLVVGWQERLTRYGESERDAGQLHEMYLELSPAVPTPLRIALLELMVEELSTLESPELLFFPPRFHPGLLCCELGRYDEGEKWFTRALDAGIQPAGRFLAYRGDSLFILGSPEPARELYKGAFLEGPLTVDMPHLADPALCELISYGESEAEEPDDLLPWLPVWGWLRNLFTLELDELRRDLSGFLDSLTRGETGKVLTAPQLWFQYLRYAEFLRGVPGYGQELVRARRRLKEINDELFGRYMRKIAGGE